MVFCIRNSCHLFFFFVHVHCLLVILSWLFFKNTFLYNIFALKIFIVSLCTYFEVSTIMIIQFWVLFTQSSCLKWLLLLFPILPGVLPFHRRVFFSEKTLQVLRLFFFHAFIVCRYAVCFLPHFVFLITTFYGVWLQ